MIESRLNLFQRLARRWDAVHPYNAAQVLRIAGRIERGRAAESWFAALHALGLGHVRVQNDGRFWHGPLNGQPCKHPLRALCDSDTIEAHLTAELNRPFDDPQEPPFRPFLLQRDDDFYFGVVYQHWVADSVSIRTLLREWFMRLFDSQAARQSPLRHSNQDYWQLFGRRGGWRIDETALAAIRSYMRHRRARKVQLAEPGQYAVRVLLQKTPAGLVEPLRERARAGGFKIHDLLLAAVAEACARHIPTQYRRNRPNFAVGSIVDLRRYAREQLSDDVFGLYLGFASVVCPLRDACDWGRLVRSVAAQSRVQKRNGMAEASTLWMTTALAVNRWVADAQLYHFYRKERPTLGGLSNVNLNDSWAVRYHPDPIREYLRVSPTGPLVPLVISTTTLGQNLSIAMTYRESLLSSEAADRMGKSFVERVTELSGRVLR